MPSIDYQGRYFAIGKSTESTACIRFPVKASTPQAAKNFADRTVLELLPGWERGYVTIKKGKKLTSHYLVRPNAKPQAK